ncbi:Serine/threonine-protein kinase-like protein CCR4, partial [Ananas comosus]
LSVPPGLEFFEIGVGGDFVCGLLRGSGEIRCFDGGGCGGGGSGVVGREPPGAHATIAAGTSHACAVAASGGELVCWGATAPPLGEAPVAGISSLALGTNRTCGLRSNGTVLCWGPNAGPPRGLAEAQFVAIQARGDALCGVLMANYSLVCWGSKAFASNRLVFDYVLPGPCAPLASCSCGILAGSGNVCPNYGGICQRCAVELPPSPANGSKRGRRRAIFIAVGVIGLAIGLAAAAFFFVAHRRNSCRVLQDAGRIHAEPAQAQAQPQPQRLLLRGVPSARSSRAPGGADSPTTMERRLSALIGKGPSSTIERFPLATLLAATDAFSEGHKIGSGSFGSVYRAVLPDGRVVAIKRAEPPCPYAAAAAASATTSSASASTSAALPAKRRDRESAFLSELALLSRVNHKNLVRLLGFCTDRAEHVLVYEFVSNGALHDHLHKRAPIAPPLASWNARLKLALDAARGIEYLHAYAVPPIIHRDIKPSNILLDDSWTAKVSDFGLSLLLSTGEDDDDDAHDTPRAAGTVGYMDPEYYRLQHLTAKSDVYSFGVVLLELLSGCKVIQKYEESGTPRNVVEFAVPHIVGGRRPPHTRQRLPPRRRARSRRCLPGGPQSATMTEIVNGLERAVSACGTPNLSRSGTERSG